MPCLVPPDANVKVEVIGPAYLDEIIEVEGALCGDEWLRAALPGVTGPVRIDYTRTEATRSVCDEPGVALVVESPGGDRIRVTDPGCAAGRKLVTSEQRLVDVGSLRRLAGAEGEREIPLLDTRVARRAVRSQLGGMGAGYALALGGRLVLPVGSSEGKTDEEGGLICGLLGDSGIPFSAVPVEGAETDVTTLLWSTAGDKLPVGRRSASLKVSTGALLARAGTPDICVVTSLPNETARKLLAALPGWTVFTPSMRNVRQGPLAETAGLADAMSMNRTEWSSVPDRDAVEEHCPLIAVTDGPRGASVGFRTARDTREWVDVPAAQVTQVLDANHAGEAFTAGFLGALIEMMGLEGLREGRYRAETVREAARQGCLAAALELGIRELRFPTRRDVMGLRRSSSGTH